LHAAILLMITGGTLGFVTLLLGRA